MFLYKSINRLSNINIIKRNIYFKVCSKSENYYENLNIVEDNKIIKLSTRRSVLLDLKSNSTHIWTVSLPIDNPMFVINFTNYVKEPYHANMIVLHKNYNLNDKQIFYLFNRLSIGNFLRYDYELLKEVLKIFINNNNLIGLYWIYNCLDKYDTIQFGERYDGPTFGPSSQVKKMEEIMYELIKINKYDFCVQTFLNSNNPFAE